MRVLITGVAGFVGSHLADFLVSQGYEVWGIVCPGSNYESVEHLRHNVRLVRCDVRDEQAVKKALVDSSSQYIYHLAARTVTFESRRCPRETYEVNFLGTVNVLEGALALKESPHILIPTSAEMYGDVSAGRAPLEENEIFRPLHPYAVSKVAVHYLIQQYVRVHNLQVVEARAFNQIGPRQKLGFVVPDFAAQLAKVALGRDRNEIRVGNLKAQRDFLDVRDAVRAYVRLCEVGRPGEVYHVCSGIGVSIEDILKTLMKFVDVPVNVVIDPEKLRPIMAPILIGSNKKLVRETGWTPQIPLETSLRETFEFWLKNIEQEHTKGEA